MPKATCIYPVDYMTGEVLMARKGRKIGKGKWFGYGGKVESGETANSCSVREFKKESGGVIIDPSRIEYSVLAKFHNGRDNNPATTDPAFEVLFGRYPCWKRHLLHIGSTPEMYDPTWFSVLKMPFNDTKEMMAADKFFLPMVLLGGKHAIYSIWQSEDGSEVYDVSMSACMELPF